MKRLQKPKRLNHEMTLQITSMADIFIIILVFLLKSYSTSSVTISPTTGMQIPASNRLEAPIEALQIEISEHAIQVENKPVLKLENFRLLSDSQTSDPAANPLSLALGKEKKRQELIAKVNPQVKLDSKILIIADQRTPYSTLKSVLGTAALNGFYEFKLVAIKKD